MPDKATTVTPEWIVAFEGTSAQTVAEVVQTTLAASIVVRDPLPDRPNLSIAISVRSDADPEHATKWPPPGGDFAGAARVVRKFGKDILEAVLTEYGYGPDDSDLIG